MSGSVSAKAVMKMLGVDGLRLRPQWARHADMATLKGQIVRLRIVFRNVKLYAFQVKS